MPFYIQRDESGEIILLRFQFAIDGTEFEDFSRDCIVTVFDVDGRTVTDEDREEVAMLFGRHLQEVVEDYPMPAAISKAIADQLAVYIRDTESCECGHLEIEGTERVAILTAVKRW